MPTSSPEPYIPHWFTKGGQHFNLMFIARAIRQAYDQRFADIDLNLSEVRLLGYVTAKGASSQTRIAESLGLGRAATGALIDGLELRKFVVRQTDPSDRRVWLVEITVAGKAVVEEVQGRDKVFRKELLHGISQEEREQMADVLARIRENLMISMDGKNKKI
jgi:MarR family transcriptional regulator for hemolysin